MAAKTNQIVNNITITPEENTAYGILISLINYRLVESEDILTLYKSMFNCTFDKEAEEVILKMMPKDDGKTYLNPESLLALMDSLKKAKKDEDTLTIPKTEPYSPWTVPYPTYPNTPSWPSYPITAGNDGRPGPEIRYYCNQAQGPYTEKNSSVAGSFVREC